MSSTVVLFTDRSTFEPSWRNACEELGLEVRTLPPEDLPSAVDHGMGVVVDAASSAFDEDELLASVGLASAVGSIVSVHLPRDNSMSGIEDVLDEMCSGGVVRRDHDVARVANLVARRLDTSRGTRFEYVTVSPRGGDVLAILGDGRSHLVKRPVAPGDDFSEVVSISLSDDAAVATLELGSGTSVNLRAIKLVQAAQGTNGKHTVPVDGAKLGARLRELRLSAGLTQAELARRTGIHRPNIARVEAGRHTPSLETLSRLASAIGVPTTSVLSQD